MLNPKEKSLYFLIPLLFGLLYFQVCFADYAYLDEIHQLWHNNDSSNFTMFHTQGRWLTGLLFQKFFSALSTIAQLKLLRVFSLTGWVLTTLLWTYLLKSWTQALGWDPRLGFIGVLFMVGSLSVGICIGWASCMEMFLGVSAALLGGHILFRRLTFQPQAPFPPVGTLALALLLGALSLFVYQTTFGAFLLPLFLYYLHQKAPRLDKVLLIGLSVYLATYGVYFLLFKLSLALYHLPASPRTALHPDPLGKLSFFFSGPLPQGFSLNLLYSASSIGAQAVYLLALVGWIVAECRTRRSWGTPRNLGVVALELAFLALLYLPLLVAQENFSSNRTLFVFDLAVFLLVSERLLRLIPSTPGKNLFTGCAALWLVLTGFYAFNVQLVTPLKREYAALKSYVAAHYTPAVQTVYFIRAERNLFRRPFGVNVYKDEFGSPSTFKDWVPEPITRQLVYELTGSRPTAEQLNILQFESAEAFRAAKPSLDAQSLLIDMNQLVR